MKNLKHLKSESVDNFPFIVSLLTALNVIIDFVNDLAQKIEELEKKLYESNNK